ncbi:MAG: hypothetical protein HKN36_12890 [Hellea sp.]|nr:hypothetical protein [Hellea sp.]
MDILTDWTAEKSDKFQKEIVLFQHGLEQSGLFTDDALIELMDKHPANQIDVCTMSDPDHPIYPNHFRTGDFRDAGGKVLLKAAQAERVFINLRKVMNMHPEYKALLEKMYGDLAAKTGNRTFNAHGGILISSPISQTPYHFDKTETILWHVRGVKSVYIYPRTQKFIPDHAYEAALTDNLKDDLPYTRKFDQEAFIHDLQPGEAISWPHASPHRVDNKTFCVSVTTEYSTRATGMKNAAMLTNATLRHRFGIDTSYAVDGKTTRYMKSIFGRVMKKAKFTPDTTDPDLVTFKIDPSNPAFVTDIEPFERNF